MHSTTPDICARKLRACDWEVRPVSLVTAQNLVERFHYSRGGSNAAVYTHGLFPRDAFFESACVGVAWWLPPTKAAAVATYPVRWQGVLALSRLVVEPDMPTNAASFLLGRSMRLIDRQTWPCLVTYADTWRGHTGAIYKATNWQYAGLTKPQRVYVLNGRMLSRKAGPKTFTHSEMLAKGAECLGSFAKHKFIDVQEVVNA